MPAFEMEMVKCPLLGLGTIIKVEEVFSTVAEGLWSGPAYFRKVPWPPSGVVYFNSLWVRSSRLPALEKVTISPTTGFIPIGLLSADKGWHNETE